MAKSKRPQRSVHAGGVPTAQIQTGVNPVDTFVDPGLAGMPQQKEGTVAPNQPDMQKARDLAALGQAFQGLSSSLGQLGQSQKKLDIAAEEWGAEQAALNKSMTGTAISFSEFIEKNGRSYMDHPGFQRGYSKAEARLFASDYHDAWEGDYERQLASNPAYNTIDGMLSHYDEGLKNAPRPNTPRKDVFESTVILAQSNGRKIAANKHRKYLSEKAVKDNTKALQTVTMQAAKAGFEYEPDPVVTVVPGLMGIPITTGLTPLTQEEIHQLKLEEVTKSLATILDDEYGGLFTPALTKQILGESLIDMAMGSDDPVFASFIKEVIENTPTGPKDSRVMLSDDPSVHPYYMTNQDRIDTQIRTGTNKAIKTAHEGHVIDMGQNVISSITQLHENDKAGLVNKHVFLSTQKQRFANTNILHPDDEGNVTGYIEVLEGNTVHLYEMIGGEREKVGSINFDDKYEEATGRHLRNLALREEESYKMEAMRDYQKGLISKGDFERKLEYGGVAGAVRASVLSNKATPELIVEFANARGRVGNDILRDTDISDAAKADVERMYFAYDFLYSLDNHSLIEDLIPDESTRDFFDFLRVIKRNKYVATHVTGTDGGTTWDGIWGNINNVKQAASFSQAQLNSDWSEAEGDRFLKASFDDKNYTNRLKLTQDVKRVARIVYTLSDEKDIKKAIMGAAESIKERLVDVGGFQTDKGTIHPALLGRNIPINKNGDLASELVFDADKYGLANDVSLSRAIKHGEGVPSLLNELFNPVSDFWKNRGWGTIKALQSKAVVRNLLGELSESLTRFKGRDTALNLSLHDITDAAKYRFIKNPPKWWTGRVPAADNEIVGLRAIPGDGGFTFEVAALSQDGVMKYHRNENGHPFTLVELISLGRWKGDRPTAGGESTFLFDTMTGTDKMVGGEMGGKLQGDYDKDGNWVYDLRHLENRLKESSRHYMGIPAGSDPTTTGYMQQ